MNLHQRFFVSLFLLLVVAEVIAQENKHYADFVPSDAKVKVIFSGGKGLLEGPDMSPDGLLYFSDITPDAEGKIAGIIWTYNPSTSETKVFRSPSGKANGMLFNADGDLVICEGADQGGRRIVKTDMKTGISTILADHFNGGMFNSPNDLAIDQKGRIYFTDPRYVGREPIEQFLMGVYCIDVDGTVRLVVANATKPNGITISPDQKKLYVASNEYPGTAIFGPMPEGFNGPYAERKTSIMEYSILPDGNLSFNKILVDLKGEGPDGIKVDVDGNIYVALGQKIAIFSPGGIRLTEINLPEEIKDGFVSNLCFGRGKYNKTLYITTSNFLYSIETKKFGFHINFLKR